MTPPRRFPSDLCLDSPRLQLRPMRHADAAQPAMTAGVTAPAFEAGPIGYCYGVGHVAVEIGGLEALASGRPVVCTRCGGPQDILDDSNGLLVDVDDVDMLAEAMQEASSREWEATALRASVLERFSKEEFVNKHIALYESIL